MVTPGMVLDDQVLEPREASFLAAVVLGERGGGLALLDASTGELRCGEVADDGRLLDELRRAGVRELLFPRAADCRPGRGAWRAGRGRAGRPARRRRVRAAARRSCGATWAWPSLDALRRGRPHPGALGRGGGAALPDRHPARRAAPRGPALARCATDGRAAARRGHPGEPRARADPLGRAQEGDPAGAARPDRHGAGRPPAGGVAPLPAARPGRHRRAARRGGGAGRLRGGARGPGARRCGRWPTWSGSSRGSCPGQGNARDLRALAGRCWRCPRWPSAARGARRRRSSPARARRLRGLEPLAAAPRPGGGGGAAGGAQGGRPHPARLLGRAGRARRHRPRRQGTIARLEAKERERTGIGSLKVRFNRVFGYYLEVTKPNLHLVPAD